MIIILSKNASLISGKIIDIVIKIDHEKIFYSDSIEFHYQIKLARPLIVIISVNLFSRDINIVLSTDPSGFSLFK